MVDLMEINVRVILVYIDLYDLVGGSPTPPKNMREVSWDDFPFPAEK
jgi:hypothetical protein